MATWFSMPLGTMMSAESSGDAIILQAFKGS